MPDAVNPDQKEQVRPPVEDIFDLEKELAPPQPEAQPIRPEVQKESAPETQPEKKPEVEKEDESARRKYAPPPTEPVQARPVQALVQKTEEQIKIENILSEHLDNLFLQMTPQQQMTFRQKGEETANKIEKLLLQAKVKAKEVLGLIREWLKFLPGLNKFFLEQEAKIKTDRILNIHEQKHKQK